MQVLSRTLTQFVDAAKIDLQQPAEEGLRVVLSADITDAATTFELTDADAAVNVSDLIEFGDELVLVTAKSADASPVYTVARGYYNSTAAAHTAATDIGVVNPQFPRIQIIEGVKRAFTRLDALGVPLVESATYTISTASDYDLELPAGTREVFSVMYVDTTDRIQELDGWRFHQDLPTGTYTNGNSLRLPRYVKNGWTLHVTYRSPYRWSTYPSEPVAASTIDIPEGAVDLPSLYAAAYCISRREVSRQDIDRADEWAAQEATRGSGPAIARLMWQEFYRSLDEARRVLYVPARRPFIKPPRWLNRIR